VRYAPLAVKRLVAAVFGFPAYAAKPRGRSGCQGGDPWRSNGEGACARALTQERLERRLRRLQAGKPQRPDAGQGSAPELCPPPTVPRPWEAFHSVPIPQHTARQATDTRQPGGAHATTAGMRANSPPIRWVAIRQGAINSPRIRGVAKLAADREGGDPDQGGDRIAANNPFSWW